MNADSSLHALEEALKVSPTNIPLRLHVAESYIHLGRYADAIIHWKALLKLEPGNLDWQVQLADAYLQNEQLGEAAVVSEAITQASDAPPLAFLVAARIAFAEGDLRTAVHHYKTAIDLDPDLQDEVLDDQLGIGPLESTSEISEGRVRFTHDEEPPAFDIEIERPKMTFADVGGMDDLKEEIRLKIIYPLQNPDLYEAYGKKIGGGIMMYGPPGCGKTHLARATAGEIDAGFLSVGINDVLDMWMGNSEKNLHELFEKARRNSPCVLFFDEVDALGGRRSDMNSGSARQIINQFLAEMDGVQHSNDGLLVLSATNAPWHVDAAFRRPGRFDRVIFVPPPDRPGRAEILQWMCQSKPVKDIDFQYLAKQTDKFSGADLKAIVDVAIESKLGEAMKTGKPVPVTGKDLSQAAARHKPTTKEWFASARNYALYANEGGLYDDILKFLDMK